MDLWQSVRTQSGSQRVSDMVRTVGPTLVRSAALGTALFVTFEASHARLDAVEPLLRPWLAGGVAGLAHAAAGIAWDSVAARQVAPRATLARTILSHVSSHGSMFGTYQCSKNVLVGLWTEAAEPVESTPAHLVAISLAGAAGGMAQGVADHYFPDTRQTKLRSPRPPWSSIFRATPVSASL